MAEYDFTFRHLMAEYPARSWAKTYLQGWNLIMRDLLPRDYGSGGPNTKSFNKDNICWPFNKGKYTDANCHKDHRCSYCGKWWHGMHVCHKRKRNGNKQDSGDSKTKDHKISVAHNAK